VKNNERAEKVDEDWVPPLLWCTLNGTAEVPKEEVFCASQIRTKAANATRQATRTLNEDEWEGEWIYIAD
jgi:hypothetical protein